MKTNVMMMEKTTGKTAIVFRCENSLTARDIADEMNRLNQEAARLTGKAVKFIYAIIAQGK